MLKDNSWYWLNEIFIKSGTPLCYLVPFKRQKFNYKIKKYNKKFEKNIRIERAKLKNSFVGNYKKNLKWNINFTKMY